MTPNTLFVYAILLVFFGLEQFLRFGQPAKDLKKTSYDKNTTGLLSWAILCNSLSLSSLPY